MTRLQGALPAFLRPPRALAGALLLLLVAASGFAAESAPAAANEAKAGITLWEMIVAGGPIEFILIGLSVITFTLAAQWTITIKREALIPEGMADEIHDSFAEGVTPESSEKARALLDDDTSMLGNVLAAALDKRDFGYEAMRDAAETVGIAEHNRYMSKVAWLSMFASSATLLGLLGTVSGIIGSFLQMSSTPGGVDPALLSKHIGEALVCTATGLIIAIGGLYCFFFLRSRVNQAAIDTGVIANEILDYFRPPQEA